MVEQPIDDCRVCGSRCDFVFRQALLDEQVNYFECKACGYLQTEMPHWLERAYGRAINDVDTGIMMRNRMNVDRVVMTLATCATLSGKVVDHAGGYGILVRLLRDAGVDAYWRDPYCENILARGFEATGKTYDLVTAFEVLEHLIDPVDDLRTMLQQAPTILVTTELIPTEKTPAPDWWYLGPEHGQHIGFFRERTLALVAQKIGAHFASDGKSVHLFSSRPTPNLWRTSQRLRRYAPALARQFLKSKTMSDFDQLRKADVDDSPSRTQTKGMASTEQ